MSAVASRRSSLLLATLAAMGTFVVVVGCGQAPTGKNDLALTDDEKEKKSNKKDTESSPEGPSGDVLPGDQGDDGEPPPEHREPDASSNAPPAPTTCTKDSECGGLGRICEEGDCIKGCRTNAQCGSGKVCEDGECVSSTPDVECTVDEHCDLGTICLSSSCIAGCYSTYDCPLGQSCFSGQCKPDVQTPPPTGGNAGGTPCTSDGQCNPGNNGSGKICSAGGTCVPGCRQDYHCPGTLICASGTCR